MYHKKIPSIGLVVMYFKKEYNIEYFYPTTFLSPFSYLSQFILTWFWNNKVHQKIKIKLTTNEGY